MTNYKMLRSLRLDLPGPVLPVDRSVLAVLPVPVLPVGQLDLPGLVLPVDRLDLVQFHWWDYSIKRYIEAADHLVQLKNAGKIAHIGVTNFDAQHLKEILDAGVNIISNQVQYSIIDHRPEKNLLPLCRESGINLLCYGALAGGFFSEHYISSTGIQEPLEYRSLTKYKLIIDDFGGFELFQELLQHLHSISRKYHVGIADVAIKYILQKHALL